MCVGGGVGGWVGGGGGEEISIICWILHKTFKSEKIQLSDEEKKKIKQKTVLIQRSKFKQD